jgi:hypothetical protein
MNRSRWLIAGLLVGLMWPLVPQAISAADNVSSQPGSIGVRIVEVTSGLSDDPRARLYIVDHVAPGTVIERQIEVSTTVSAAPVEIYPAAASIENGFFSGAEGRTVNELSNWTSVYPKILEIPRQSSARATVVIEVPADASPGERYAVVWVQARTVEPESGGVAQISRVGIRIYLSVGPGGPPAADFQISALTAGRSDTGEPFVLASVSNTGGRALDLLGSLTLTDGPGGLTAGPYPVDVAVTLGVGETELVEIRLDTRIPAGPWLAELTLVSGLVERTVRGEITFPNSGLGEPVPVQGPLPAWLLLIVGLLILSIVGGAAYLVWSRMKGKHQQQRPAVRSTDST